ncbi:hypothetical protein [Roseivivax isoporae]|uniref:Uncharacterized protein n=1 Tax=Roseivivax isoporae LMG 25204 TaxID=1449351 RepID=X7FD84_9RHOB|nr:hypothetical protein [Roseivivax isoporae]ETX30021.1 hypothetical protein RISW2_19690 [Roseivivax isoporae LMG 25204]
MLITSVAILIAVVSAALAVLSMREVASGTALLMRSGVRRTLRSGRLAPTIAFVCLWLMIFGLSFA